ncbi:hypothetical protein R69608_00639 [Paraburkholderia nemoris]|nr:hypothetical protein R69608_00639 [Paraburkholderia nemoris]
MHSRTGSEISVESPSPLRLTHIKPMFRVAFERPPRSVTFLGVRNIEMTYRLSEHGDAVARQAHFNGECALFWGSAFI